MEAQPKRYGPYKGTKYGHLLYKDEYPDGRKVTVWVHREVMERKLGRKLLTEEEVHHKDEDPTNNRPDNLELKLKGDHCRLHCKKPDPEMVEVTCLECGEKRTMLARQVRHSQGHQKKAGPFCSRSCAGRYNARKRWN